MNIINFIRTVSDILITYLEYGKLFVSQGGIVLIIHGLRTDLSKLPARNEFSMLTENGQNSHGTWELSEKIYKTQKRYSIILNDTFEYIIQDLNTDEITFSDHINKYLLVRRL